jgi:hypothetical protein
LDILNASLILLKKESTRYDKVRNQAWNHAQILTPKGMELMEDVRKVNVQDFKFHLAENEHHHTAVVSKKSLSKEGVYCHYPKTDTMGSRFGKCTCGFPKKEGIPCDYMVAIFKLGRINGLTRIAIMLHWYTTTQWCNQFPKYTYKCKLLLGLSTPSVTNNFHP